MQTFCAGKPVNIDLSGPLAPTQQNPVVQILNWAVTIWDAKSFMRSYTELGNGYIGTNRLLFPIPPIRAVKVSDEDDFRFAERQLMARELAIGTPEAPRYWTPND